METRPHSRATDAFQQRWSVTHLYSHTCISPIFFNKQDSEESKTRKSGYGFNNSALANSTLVQSEFGDVHKKISTALNLPIITTRFTGQLTLINSGEVSSTSGL